MVAKSFNVDKEGNKFDGADGTKYYLITVRKWKGDFGYSNYNRLLW